MKFFALASTSLISLTPLLAQYRAMGNRFRRSQFDAWGFVVMGAMIGFAVVGAFVAYQIHLARERWKHQSPEALFYELCNVHGIQKSLRKRLLRGAILAKLEHPALIFLSQASWEEENFRNEIGAEHEKLKTKLFGRPPCEQSPV
jgi:hypothetical protein